MLSVVSIAHHSQIVARNGFDPTAFITISSVRCTLDTQRSFSYYPFEKIGFLSQDKGGCDDQKTAYYGVSRSYDDFIGRCKGDWRCRFA
jgi:hypothetical protein